MHKPHSPKQNRILAALPEPVLERLIPSLELVQLELGEVIYESGDSLSYVYFPTTFIASKLYLMESGASTEVCMVGNEGVVGASLLMSDETPSRIVVQNAGHAYQIKGSLLKQEFSRHGGRRSGVLHDLILRYTQTLLSQMEQTAVCNQHHSVMQRFTRWLLLSLDRLPSNELTITQEWIANMLGVRRESVTEAAGKLQQAGLIQYRRGHIEVLNRPGLETEACECYKVLKKQTLQLFANI